MNRDNRAEKPLWANLRDTHGRDVPSANPFARLISAHPALRGKDAGELASALGIPQHEAEGAIMAYVHDALPPELVPHAPGRSVDARLMMAGRPAPAGWVSSSREGARVETHGPRGDAGALGGSGGVGSAPLPIGWAYRMAARVTRDPQGQMVSVDPPTAYDAQCATILRSNVPSDPNDPGMPAPEWVRAFCVAMGGDLKTTDGGAWSAPGFQWGGLDPQTLTPTARGVVEDVGSWPAPQAGEIFNGAAIRNAYAAFNWYGPLSGDVETADGNVTWSWDAGDKVTRERYVFFYLQASDASWNKCVQVQGFSQSKNQWILANAKGEDVRLWAWRPTDSQFVGEWKSFFDLRRWLDENANAITEATIWVGALAVTAVTLGAAGGTVAAAAAASAAFTAAANAVLALRGAYANGDWMAAFKAVVSLGAAANTAAGGDLVTTIGKENPGLAAMVESVAKPFQSVFDAAQKLEQSVAPSASAIWDAATALRKSLPQIGPATWAQAHAICGQPADTFESASTWLQMARLPSTADVANELLANAPPWAHDAIAFGLALSATEQAQSFTVAKTVMFAPQLVKGGQSMMFAPQAVKAGTGTRALWASTSSVPPPAANPAAPKLVPTAGGSGKAGGGSSAAAPLVLAGAAVALWFAFGRK